MVGYHHRYFFGRGASHVIFAYSLVLGSECVNRALDGDVVAVEIIPYAKPVGLIGTSQKQFSVEDQVSVGDVTAAPSIEALEGLSEGTTTTSEQPGKWTIIDILFYAMHR